MDEGKETFPGEGGGLSAFLDRLGEQKVVPSEKVPQDSLYGAVAVNILRLQTVSTNREETERDAVKLIKHTLEWVLSLPEERRNDLIARLEVKVASAGGEKPVVEKEGSTRKGPLRFLRRM